MKSLLLMTIAMLAAASPEAFRQSVELMEHASEAQADSIAASLLTSPEELEAVSFMARDSLFTVGSPWHNERIYASFARAIMASPIASVYQRSLAEWELSTIALNAPGTPAADFRVLPLQGPESTMRELTAGTPHMLYFYNPDCRHCSQVMQQLRALTLPCPVLAVCVEATEQRWRDTADALPDGWIPALDLTDVQDSELYIFQSTPAIYMLDAEGRVTAKNLSASEIETLCTP